MLRGAADPRQNRCVVSGRDHAPLVVASAEVAVVTDGRCGATCARGAPMGCANVVTRGSYAVVLGVVPTAGWTLGTSAPTAAEPLPDPCPTPTRHRRRREITVRRDPAREPVARPNFVWLEIVALLSPSPRLTASPHPVFHVPSICSRPTPYPLSSPGGHYERGLTSVDVGSQPCVFTGLWHPPCGV